MRSDDIVREERDIKRGRDVKGGKEAEGEGERVDREHCERECRKGWAYPFREARSLGSAP